MTELTQDLLRSLLHYNQMTGVFTWVSKPHGKVMIGDVAGSVNGDGYTVICIDKVKYRAHRLAFLWMEGETPEFVDHYDHVRTNNAWSNLGAATRTENNRNVKLREDNTSGFTGVSWIKENRKWRSVINVDGKKISLGCFESKEKAALKRQIANILYGFHENHGMIGP